MRALVRAKLGVVGVCATAMLLACSNETADSNTTNTVVTVQNMESTAGTDGVFSDVCDNEQGPLGFPVGCVVVHDSVTVTMEGYAKNVLSNIGVTPIYNDVVFNRYRVTYVRADGRNVPGVDVPYPFDGAVNFLVQIGQDTTTEIMIVREQGKLEPPLINLAGNGGAVVISTLATVDFYGKDGAGRPIQVQGFINVTFGDFPVDGAGS